MRPKIGLVVTLGLVGCCRQIASILYFHDIRVVGVLGLGAEGPGFKSQPRRCRVTVLSKLLTPIVPLFTKQRNW